MSTSAQSLKDSLFGGRMKIDTSKKVISRASADSLLKISVEPGKQVDSLPKAVDLMYKERITAWKKWFESYSGPYLLNATSSKKVKDGEYLVKIKFEVGMEGNITLLSLTCTPTMTM